MWFLLLRIREFVSTRTTDDRLRDYKVLLSDCVLRLDYVVIDAS